MDKVGSGLVYLPCFYRDKTEWKKGTATSSLYLSDKVLENTCVPNIVKQSVSFWEGYTTSLTKSWRTLCKIFQILSGPIIRLARLAICPSCVPSHAWHRKCSAFLQNDQTFGRKNVFCDISRTAYENCCVQRNGFRSKRAKCINAFYQFHYPGQNGIVHLLPQCGQVVSTGLLMKPPPVAINCFLHFRQKHL